VAIRALGNALLQLLLQPPPLLRLLWLLLLHSGSSFLQHLTMSSTCLSVAAVALQEQLWHLFIDLTGPRSSGAALNLT